jgi:hypothetical protein
MIGLDIGDIHGSQLETIDFEQLHSKRLSFPPARNLDPGSPAHDIRR